MAQLYLLMNSAKNTTAAPTAVTTGTSIKTLLQVKPLTIMRVVEWGISFDGSAANTPIKVEMIEVDVAATVTASADADITKYGPGVADAEVFSTFATLSTTGTGYTASAEGSVTVVRNLAGPQFIAPTAQFIQQFPLGREPVILKNQFGRIRTTAGTAVNAYCYMVLEV